MEVVGGVVETVERARGRGEKGSPLALIPFGPKEPRTKGEGQVKRASLGTDTFPEACEKSIGKKAAPDSEGAWAGTWLVGPQEGGEASTGTGPGVSCDVRAVRRGDFGEVKDTVEFPDSVEGFEVSASDARKGLNGFHETLVGGAEGWGYVSESGRVVEGARDGGEEDPDGGEPMGVKIREAD